MKEPRVTAILFVKDLPRVAAFYAGALGMSCTVSDADHSVLNCRGFELIVHQIPHAIAAQITIEQPPQRRVTGAIRLDFPVHDVAESRRLARSLGGDIDTTPPPWADASANFFLGYDPEGNQIGISEHAA
jgi:predicted enzyme related to lactoylglutathione lyase